MTGEKLLLIGVGAALLGSAAWYLATIEPLAHAATGIDPSGSVVRNCGGLRAATQAMIGGRSGIREGSTLTVLVMGADARNTQPAIAFTGPVPIAPDTVMGRDEEAFRQQHDAFFGEVELACETAANTNNSPIYELVKQGIAHLRSLGCTADGRCSYLVKTDLDDDVHPALRDAIARSVKDANVAIPSGLAGSIDNAGIALTFCGVSEVERRRTASSSPDARIRIWSALFTHPELVSFQPFCS
jgi:hypothetical protein